MKQKRTPADYALWAALPMAQTSQIEGRLTIILDQTRRRASPRRFLWLAATSAAAILLPLAMLRPTAKARAVSPATSQGLVEIAGITDAANGDRWDVNGKPLSEPNLLWAGWVGNKKFTAKPGQKALFFDFRLSPSLRNVPAMYDVSSTTLDGITMTALGHAPHQKIGVASTTMRSLEVNFADGTNHYYAAAFPASLARTKIRVGAAIGPWATAATAQYRFNTRHYLSISNFSQSHYQPAKFVFSGSRILFTILSKTSGDLYEFRVIALDKKGHSILLPDVESNDKGGSEQITARIPQGVSVKEVRIQAMPYVWTEFKDVALQPIKS